MAAKRTVAAFKLEPRQREGLELIAKGRGVTHHEITRRAVIAYVAACFESSDRLVEVLKAGDDREPDLASWRRGAGAFPDAGH
jgi:hypothetical protein